MIYFITDEFPAGDDVIETAKAAGAVILHGVPAALAGTIPVGTLGLVEIDEPEPAEVPEPKMPANAVSSADLARAIAKPLETLTGGSSSTATRNALLSVRAELDKLIGG